MNGLQTITSSSRTSQRVTKQEETPSKSLRPPRTWPVKLDLHQIGSDTSFCQVCSKREALQAISRIYDPLGLFSLATLNGKQFIQELWKQELDWDKLLTELEPQEWYKLHDGLSPLSSVSIPRYIDGDEYKLFCVTNAPDKASSAAVYLYSTDTGQNCQC